VDVFNLLDDVTAGLKDFTKPLRIAVMGCIVNGPGEAREADLGVAAGNGKGQIFVKGEVIRTVPESEIVPTLLALAEQIAAESPVSESEETAGASATARIGVTGLIPAGGEQ
jgi:(E)-4-hydroxy-3-methylbut-2-enyl-diphosphate synthase